ncbi:MAG: hypothetical protein ACJAUD_001842 [Crocinitomicaceae bacterium]|jgi:hypothetical protein
MGSRNTATVYPNPFESSFHLKLNNDQTQIASVRLIDVSGRAYYKNNIQFVKGMNDIEIVTPDLDKGVYYLSVQLENALVRVKVVKK